jgi:hypothetical protein
MQTFSNPPSHSDWTANSVACRKTKQGPQHAVLAFRHSTPSSIPASALQLPESDFRMRKPKLDSNVLPWDCNVTSFFNDQFRSIFVFHPVETRIDQFRSNSLAAGLAD